MQDWKFCLKPFRWVNALTKETPEHGDKAIFLFFEMFNGPLTAGTLNINQFSAFCYKSCRHRWAVNKPCFHDLLTNNIKSPRLVMCIKSSWVSLRFLPHVMWMSQCTAETNAGQNETTQPVAFVVCAPSWPSLDGWTHFICIFRTVTSIE